VAPDACVTPEASGDGAAIFDASCYTKKELLDQHAFYWRVVDEV